MQPYGLYPARILCLWHSPGKNIGVGCHALFQGNLSNPGITPVSLKSALSDRFFTTSTTWEAQTKAYRGKKGLATVTQAAGIHLNLSTTPALLPGKSHRWRSLVGCSPWGCKESDTTEQLHFPFSLSRIGEGNGNPLQCSCLENPKDGGAWWAAVYGVAQSRTRLKRLSSSSSSKRIMKKVWK